MIISHQEHSRNDVREWNALFRKGATSLKIDPHFIASGGMAADTFILSHNTPLPWQWRRNEYSTTDDLLTYFQHPPSFLSGKSIDIALCFKAAPKDLCDNKHNSEVKKWIQMAETFFTKAEPIVKHLKDNMNVTLTFILDGDGKPCDCLAKKFLPWNSTWIDHDKCSQECYNSNDGFCQRFTILNDPVSSNWVGMATNKSHYGKFGLNQNQPLQVWEPDAQLEISNLVEGYRKGYEKGVPSGGGLVFAINVDITMFETFAARTLAGTSHARGFNHVIQDGGAVGATKPTILYQSPREMTLQYWTEPTENATRRKVKRIVNFEPFTQLEVGSPLDDSATAMNVGFSRHEAIVSRRRTDEDGRNHELILKRFLRKDKLISSWSGIEVDNYAFLFAAVDGKVYATTRRVSRATETAEFSDFRLIGLGTHVHASSLKNAMLVVTEGNHCYNSHENNIRAGPLVCRPQAHKRKHSCPYALDYSLGTAENWFLWLQSEKAVITSCNEHILHATFSGGRNPSGALFPLHDDDAGESQVEGKIGIMVAHEPFPQHAKSKCGTPFTGEAGVVLSSFASYVVKHRLDEAAIRIERIPFSFDHDFMAPEVWLVLGLGVCLLITRLWRRSLTARS